MSASPILSRTVLLLTRCSGLPRRSRPAASSSLSVRERVSGELRANPDPSTELQARLVLTDLDLDLDLARSSSSSSLDCRRVETEEPLMSDFPHRLEEMEGESDTETGNISCEKSFQLSG